MKAKATRSFRPAVHALEGRIALSFSFSNLLHTVFPFIPNHKAHKPAHVKATRSPHHPAVVHVARHAHVQIPKSHHR